MRGWPLTGRTEELDLIGRVLDAPGSYRGVAIVGWAGVGKSRLAHEAATGAAARGWAVRWILGSVTSRTIPMGAFAEWTDGVDGNPLRLVRQVFDALVTSADNAPMLIAVDDAHLLDDLSAFVLMQLVVRGVAHVVATIRSGEAAPDPVSALWKDGQLGRLDLQPLSRPECDSLLRTVLGGPVDADCADRIWDMTRGNVLYLRELIDQECAAGRLAQAEGRWRWTGRIEASPTLVDLVEAQIGSCSEPVYEVLDLVAVAEPLERRALAMLAAPAQIDAAEKRGLISAADGSSADLVRVGHPLYGEIRRARAGTLRLHRMRGRVAEALARDPAADPVRVGILWLDSDLDPDRVLLARAAEAAVVRLDLALAERFAAAAVGAGGGLDTLVLWAHLLVLLNQGDTADRILHEIDRGDVPEALWANVIHLRAANLLWPLGDPLAAWQVIDDALAEHPTVALSAHLKAVRAVALAMAARPDEAIAEMSDVDRSALEALPALVGLWGLTLAHGDLGAPRSAADCAAEGYRLAAGAPQATYQGVGLAEFHVSAMGLAGLIGDAVAAADHTYLQCLEAPGISRSVGTAVRGLAALYAGDLATALDCLGSACADFAAYGDTTGVFYRFSIAYTEVLARSGRRAATDEMQARMHQARHPTFEFVAADGCLADAWAAAARGRVTEARALAGRAVDIARGHGQWAREVLGLQTLLQFGDLDPAIGTRLDELAGVVDGPRARLAARYAHALQSDDPAALVAVAADIEDIGDRLTAADVLAAAADRYARCDRRGSALNAAERAVGIMRACGAVSPAIAAVLSPLPLSPAEREVAALVADGMSNRDIAAALGMPLRTVEGHLYRSFSKLGVRKRNALAALLSGPSGTAVPKDR